MVHGRLVVTRLLACSLLFVGCDGGITGIAFLHITDLDEPCPAVNADGTAKLDEFVFLPFRRAHATSAYHGGSEWSGGNVIAMAWRDDDGTIGRLAFDIGPDRGYGITDWIPPPAGSTTSLYQETVGFVEWNGTERRFAALRANGVVNYQRDDPPGSHDSDDTFDQGEFYAHLAFDGVGPAGEPLCRILGVHATPDRERVDAYDPTWLEPSATMMFSTVREPTFSAERPPTDKAIAPDLAGPDPGGEPPDMHVRQLETRPGNGGTGGCD